MFLWYVLNKFFWTQQNLGDAAAPECPPWLRAWANQTQMLCTRTSKPGLHRLLILNALIRSKKIRNQPKPPHHLRLAAESSKLRVVEAEIETVRFVSQKRSPLCGSDPLHHILVRKRERFVGVDQLAFRNQFVEGDSGGKFWNEQR